MINVTDQVLAPEQEESRSHRDCGGAVFAQQTFL